MADRIDSMEAFVRVAALGGFSVAARSLGLSPTMVTKHVAALEDRLGVKLLHRSTRRLSLTEAGRTYRAACERILADVVDAEATASAGRIEPQGMLRLNVPVSFGVREIAPLLPDFAALYPKVTVDLGLNDRFVDLLEEGWDLAIRIGRLVDSSLIVRRLAPCRVLVCASPAYLSRHGTPESIADLADHNCLGYTLSSNLSAETWAFGSGGDTRMRVGGDLRASNGDALVAAACAGQGIIYQPTFLVADALRSGALMPLTLDRPPIELPGIFAIHPGGREPPAKVRSFIDFLAARFVPIPPWERGLAA